MRLKNTVNNVIANLSLMVIRTVLMFVSRMVFVHALGKTYLGVNGLMTNVLSMLSLAELGIGTAINFSLYKPLAEGDTDKVGVLMSFYKRAYQLIGAVVAIAGMLLLPFIGYLIKGGAEIRDLQLIYLLYLVNSVSTYFVAYKETLVNADQKNYKIAPLIGMYSFLTIVIQMAVLLHFGSFPGYLAVQIAIGFIQRAVINRYITGMYRDVDFKHRGKLPDEERRQLTKNVRGMLLHKLGEYSIYGTDNIVISAFINIGLTGIYSNYAMIISTVNSVLLVIFSSATASFGELFAGEAGERQHQTFLRFDFLGFWLFGWSAIGLFVLLPEFIRLCFGADYLMSSGAVLLVCLNFYMTGMRIPVNIIKQAAGIYYEDRFVPLLQGLINLVISVILAAAVGLEGVFIGTVLSGLLPQLLKPVILYRQCFPAVSAGGYFRRQCSYLGELAVALALTMAAGQAVSGLFPAGARWTAFICRLALCAAVPNLVFWVLNHRCEEFLYYRRLLTQWLSGRSRICVRRADYR